jgi:hypothetical protein
MVNNIDQGALVFFFLGGIFGIIGLVQVLRVMRFSSWKLTQGRIMSSRVEDMNTGDGADYRPRIEYDFVINGKMYTGTRVRLAGNTDHSEYTAEKTVQKYPRGKAVYVFYNPRDPRQCTLERGAVLPAVLFLVVGIIMLAAGALVMV